MYQYTRTAGVTAFLVAWSVGAAPAQEQSAVQEQLRELERSSHQFWLERDREALDSIMAEQFLVVPPNGALEPKAYVLGRGEAIEAGGPPPPRPDRLEVEPERIELHGNTAVVISRLRSFTGDRVRGQGSRALSVFHRSSDGKWQLIARSITPVLYARGAEGPAASLEEPGLPDRPVAIVHESALQWEGEQMYIPLYADGTASGLIVVNLNGGLLYGTGTPESWTWLDKETVEICGPVNVLRNEVGFRPMERDCASHSITGKTLDLDGDGEIDLVKTFTILHPLFYRDRPRD